MTHQIIFSVKSAEAATAHLPSRSFSQNQQKIKAVADETRT